MNAKQSSFSAFAVDLARAQANEIILEKPLQIFWQIRGPDANERAAVLEEFYTEGRNRRDPGRPDPKGEA